MNLSIVKRAINRHFKMKSFDPYERVLKEVSTRGDVWMVSQGEYITWWQKRQNASLNIVVSNTECWVSSDLADAVFEKIPQEFLDSEKVICPDSSFSGELQLVIDPTLERKHLLIDALQREGIMNITVGQKGQFFLSHELDDLLEKMEGYLRRGEWKDYNQTILDVRNRVITLLANYGLPLIRIWYHPRVAGRVIKAVFSSRYDVDRAITNMPKIFRLEKKYNTSSTAYVRVLHPFYTDADIKKLDALPYRGEIALHAEFGNHSKKYGDELAAAQLEKAQLEKILGRPVAGVSIHGGEIASNTSRKSFRVIEKCKFVYDTAHGPLPYYFPYRSLNAEGQLENTYRIRYHFRDIGIPYENFAEAFYRKAIRCLDEVLEHNGVLVLLLHPEYFGFFTYLFNPKNFFRFVRFIPIYLARVWKLNKNQHSLKMLD